MSGKASQEAGAAFEKRITEQLPHLYRLRLADVSRTKPDYNFIKMLPKGFFKAVYSKKPSVDFEGNLSGGQRVVFDTKSTGEARFEFDLISDAQLEYLAKKARSGSLAFILAEQRHEVAGGALYVIPVTSDAKIAGRSHKRNMALLGKRATASIHFDELASEGLKVRGGKLWPHAVDRLLTSGAWPASCDQSRMALIVRLLKAGDHLGAEEHANVIKSSALRLAAFHLCTHMKPIS